MNTFEFSAAAKEAATSLPHCSNAPELRLHARAPLRVFPE
jgi:hypothetical protein